MIWNGLITNPCAACELPKKERWEAGYFTEAQARQFLEAAETDKYYALFVLAIETGMRPGEYLGLQWGDIDFAKQRLSVRRVMVSAKGGGFVFEDPKTDKSRRSIPVRSHTVELLKEHRRKQLEERLSFGSVYQNYDLVFPSEIGTPLLHQNLTRRHFKEILRKENERITKANKETGSNDPLLPLIRLYDLRHTTATLLLSAGENPKIVSERLGHASIVLTLDTYSHVLPNMQESATDKMEVMLAKRIGQNG